MSILINPYTSAWNPSKFKHVVSRYHTKSMTTFVDNDPVGTLKDFVGVYDASASGSVRPIFKSNSGSPFVQFDGIDDRMTTSLVDTFGDFAVFAVFRPHNLGTANYCRLVDKSYSTGFWCGMEGGTSTFGGGIQEGAPYGHYISMTNNTWYAFMFQRNGTTKTIKTNGTTVNQTVSSTACDTNALVIGDDISSVSKLQMDLKELVICDDDISAPELSNLVNYCSSEYGLTL